MLFQTHTGEIVAGERLCAALNEVANDWAELAHAIRKENAYADHVTEEQKEANLLIHLGRAEEIRNGVNVNNFTVWQRINLVLTGECVALLP